MNAVCKVWRSLSIRYICTIICSRSTPNSLINNRKKYCLQGTDHLRYRCLVLLRKIMVFVVDFCVTFFTLTPCWLLTFGQSLYVKSQARHANAIDKQMKKKSKQALTHSQPAAYHTAFLGTPLYHCEPGTIQRRR